MKSTDIISNHLLNPDRLGNTSKVRLLSEQKSHDVLNLPQIIMPYTQESLLEFIEMASGLPIIQRGVAIQTLGELGFDIVTKIYDIIPISCLDDVCKNMDNNITLDDLYNSYSDRIAVRLYNKLFQYGKIKRDFDENSFHRLVDISKESLFLSRLSVYFNYFNTDNIVDKESHTLVLYLRYEQFHRSWYDFMKKVIRYCLDRVKKSQKFGKVAIVLRSPGIFDVDVFKQFYRDKDFQFMFIQGAEFKELSNDEKAHFVHFTDGSHDTSKGGKSILPYEVIKNSQSKGMSFVVDNTKIVQNYIVGAQLNLEIASPNQHKRDPELFSEEKGDQVFQEYTKLIHELFQEIDAI